MRTVRTILSSIGGGALGALGGALLLGVPTYFSNASGFFGPERDFAPMAALIGAGCGLLPGIVIGFFIGLFRTKIWVGTVVGAGVGFLLLFLGFGLLVFISDSDPILDLEVAMLSVVCVPIAALIGLLVALVNSYSLPATQDESLDRNTDRAFTDANEWWTDHPRYERRCQ